MIEACGDHVALSPGEVKAVITLEWERTVLGVYELSGFVLGDQALKFEDIRKNGEHPLPEPVPMGPAYRQGCLVTVREYPNGRVVSRVEFMADDPKETVSGGPTGPTATAEWQVRAQVDDYLRSFATGR